MGLLASKPVVKAGRDSTPWCSANMSCQMIRLVVGGFSPVQAPALLDFCFHPAGPFRKGLR